MQANDNKKTIEAQLADYAVAYDTVSEFIANEPPESARRLLPVAHRRYLLNMILSMRLMMIEKVA